MRKRVRLSAPGAFGAILGLGLVTAGQPAVAQDKPAPEKPVKPLPPKPAPEGSITERKLDDLMKDLLSTDDVRREVAETELPRRGKAAIPPLVTCLHAADQPAHTRLSAAKILRRLLVPTAGAVDADAAAAIADVFRDAHAPLEVRGEAAMALGDLKVTQAIPELVEGLDDSWFKVSENARAALVRLGQSSVDALCAAYEKEIAAKEGRDGIIYRSLLILGDVGGDKARATLAAALKTKEGPRAIAIRAHAARALGMTGDRLSIQPLIEAYEGEHDFDVAQAIERSLEWLTDQHDILPQPLRWKAWWEAHRDVILGGDEAKYKGLLLPKGGLKPGDPLQAPGLKTTEEAPAAKASPAPSAPPQKP